VGKAGINGGSRAVVKSRTVGMGKEKALVAGAAATGGGGSDEVLEKAGGAAVMAKKVYAKQ